MTIQQRSDEALLVNAHGNGLADCRVLNDAELVMFIEPKNAREV